MDITISPGDLFGSPKQSFTDPNTVIYIKILKSVGGGREYFNSKTEIILTDLNPEDKVIIGVTGVLTSNETIHINSTGDQYLTVEDMTQKVGTVITSFRNNNRLTRTNINNSDMSNITNMQSAFSYCTSLTSVTLPNNLSNVTNMQSTFNTCNNLTSIALPNDLSNVTNMTDTFYGCNSLTIVELPDSLSNVTSMNGTFRNCFNLTNITLPNDLSNVTNMTNTFNSCGSLTSVELPNDLSNVTGMNSAFNGCNSLTSISPLNMEFPNVTTVNYGWANCTNFNGSLSNWKFKSDVNNSYYDYNTPNWLPEHKPQFIL